MREAVMNARHAMHGPYRVLGTVALLGLAVGLGTVTLGTGSRLPVGTTLAAATRPNILFILTDDLDMYEIAAMPILQERMVAKGISFSQALVGVTICCPSRATILRGQYSHNTGIKTNGGANGGFATAYASGLETSTIATWLHDAGYLTAHVGKYLNGYPTGAGRTYIPPGWDEWYSAVGGTPYQQYNYTLNENGTLVYYGGGPEDYGTKVYTRKTQEFITRAAAADRPFFAFLAVYAPHDPFTPAPEDTALFPDARAPRPPSYNEADVTDKPAWIQAIPPMNMSKQANSDLFYRLRIQALQSVDRSIGQLIGTLSATGQLANTYIVFASDNGFHLGQHRLARGKQTAYEEDVHVPLIVRGPGVPVRRKRPHMVGNIDLAPTFADLAGVSPPPFVDGRSIVPLLGATPPATSTWRHAYLLANWDQTGVTAVGPGPLEPPDGDEVGLEATEGGVPEFAGVRTPRYTYVELASGERELYDHAVDPYELNNIASTAGAALLRRLHAKLEALQNCAGANCRVADQ
jgi:arylsulfatase A-like enzyme